MSEASVTLAENSYEQLPTDSMSVRRAGILSIERYNEAMQDPDTLVINGEPALVPLRYADGAGYDVERCQSEILTTAAPDTIWVMPGMKKPLESVTPDTVQALMDGIRARGEGYIFYNQTHHNDGQDALQDVLKHSGIRYENVPLLDDEAKEGSKEASLSLYGVDVPKVEGENQAFAEPDTEALYMAYVRGVAEGKYPKEMVDGLALLKGTEISDQLAEDMWAVYLDRFEWLGKNHPISMEDTKEDFLNLLRDEQTVASIFFEESKPACFAYLSTNKDALYWLEADFLNNDKLMQMNENQQLLFFPGIVAKAKGAGYAYHVLSLITNAMYDTEVSYKVIFENTNKSEAYIPKIVRSSVNSTRRGEIDMPNVIDKTDYRCVHVNPSI